LAQILAPLKRYQPAWLAFDGEFHALDALNLDNNNPAGQPALPGGRLVDRTFAQGVLLNYQVLARMRYLGGLGHLYES
jgi:hypothetical protein